MSPPLSPAPRPAIRLVPSRFPPIGLFDSVATAADLPAVLELCGWTNDRLVADRVRRLPEAEWVYGRPNASVVMAAFLHVAPGGARFNGPDLGAWYAAESLATAAAEVGHHLRREAAASARVSLSRRFRAYHATILGAHVDLRGRAGAHGDLLDPSDYRASQAFAEARRAAGSDGILWDSLRRAGGVSLAALRPSLVTEVMQGEHCEITVAPASRTIDVRLLKAGEG